MGELKLRGRIWWVRYCRDGRRFEESSHSTKKGAAIDLLKRREGAIANGEPVTPKIGRLRFEEAAQDVINDYKINGKRTVDDVELRIRLHLAPYLPAGASPRSPRRTCARTSRSGRPKR